jgi:hypothetical protein
MLNSNCFVRNHCAVSINSRGWTSFTVVVIRAPISMFNLLSTLLAVQSGVHGEISFLDSEKKIEIN